MLVKVNLAEDFICACESALRLYQTTKHCLICVKQKLTLSLNEILTPIPCINGWPIKSKLWPIKWMFNHTVLLKVEILQLRFMIVRLKVSPNSLWDFWNLSSTSFLYFWGKICLTHITFTEKNVCDTDLYLPTTAFCPTMSSLMSAKALNAKFTHGHDESCLFYLWTNRRVKCRVDG